MTSKHKKFYLESYQNSIQLCTLSYWLNAKFRFRLPPQPNGTMTNHSILRPGCHSVRILDAKCTVGILRTYCTFNLCRKKFGQHWILWFKKTHHHGNVLNEWINVPRLVLYTWPSWPHFFECSFWDILLYVDTFGNVFIRCMVKCQRKTNLLVNVWNSKWSLFPSIHHMRNTRDYFLTMLS